MQSSCVMQLPVLLPIYAITGKIAFFFKDSEYTAGNQPVQLRSICSEARGKARMAASVHPYIPFMCAGRQQEVRCSAKVGEECACSHQARLE